MRAEVLKQLNACRAANRPCVLVKNLDAHDSRVLEPGLHVSERDSALHQAAVEALNSDRCFYGDLQGQSHFIQPFNPPLRLVIVGAVHIAQHLAAMAQSCGYAVVVADPRPAFAAAERFPGVTLNRDWPDQAVERLAPDSRTALVALTHDPKLDDPALSAALRSAAFYVGALGSRKTHAARQERLRQAGLGEADIARLHAPVGLDIGARSPAEIALSIMAQLVAELRRR